MINILSSICRTKGMQGFFYAIFLLLLFASDDIKYFFISNNLNQNKRKYFFFFFSQKIISSSNQISLKANTNLLSQILQEIYISQMSWSICNGSIKSFMLFTFDSVIYRAVRSTLSKLLLSLWQITPLLNRSITMLQCSLHT